MISTPAIATRQQSLTLFYKNFSLGINFSHQRMIGFVAILSVLLLLSACTGQKGDALSDKLTVDLTGYNHTDYGFQFGVQIGETEMTGHPLGPHNGGGQICCLIVPWQYKPHMKVTVEWPAEDIKQPNHKREVEIAPYDGSKGATMLAVHIFQDQHVEVYVTYLGWGHPDYPVKAPL